MPQQDKRLYPLTSYSIGIWKTPEKTKAYLLVLDKAEPTNKNRRVKTDQKQFVVLVTRESDARGRQNDNALSVNWLLGCVRQQISLQLRHKNPFVDHSQQPDEDTSVLTFEINWSNIVGMDFKWPLTDDPKLVLEASVITKRVFASVEDVCLFYQAQPRVSKSPRMSLNRLAAYEQQDQLQRQQQQQAALLGSGTDAGTGSKLLTSKHHAQVVACEVAQQQHHQQAGSNISRVSSWASWTSSAGRISSEQLNPTASATKAPAGTAACGSGSPASPAVDLETAAPGPCLLPNDNQQLDAPANAQQQLVGLQSAVANTAQCSYDQAWAAAAIAKPMQLHTRNCSCSSCDSGLPCSLSTAPTLSAGIAAFGSYTAADGDSAAAAAAAVLGSASSISWEGFGECPTPPSEQEKVLRRLQDCEPRSGDARYSGLRICTSYGSIDSAEGRPGSACSSAGSPLRRTTVAASAATAVDSDEVAAGDSFDTLGHAQLSAHPLKQLLGAVPAGYATAPCSMPNSPRVGLGGRTGSGFFSAALGAEEGSSQQQHVHLLQHVAQPLQQLYQQQQLQERQQSKTRHTSATSTRGSSRLRTPPCPLCNQPLLQPLPVLQQRFHQQQEARHRRSNSRGVGKASSACSLRQLVQQAEAARGVSSSNSQHKGELQQKQPKSPSSRSVGSVSTGVDATSGEYGAAATGVKQPGTCSSPMASQVSSTVFNAQTDCNSCSKVQDDSEQLQAELKALASADAFDGVCCRSSTATAPGSSAADPVEAVDVVAKVESAPAAKATPFSQEFTKVDDTAKPADAADVGCEQQLPPQGLQDSVYRTRTVIMTFRDPTLPHKLRQFVSSDVRLLKLYESGLPGWAVMLPSYGLYYRPVLRRVTWLLFVLLSVVSMAMGFYDLYKNVPYFKQVMVAMFRPAAAVFEWLEGHTQIRLSILLTYMLGRTQLLVQLIKFLTHTSLQPILGSIATALAPLTSAVSALGTTIAWLLQPLVSAVQVLAGPASMLARLVSLLLQLLWQLVSLVLWSGPLQLLQAIGGLFMGLVQLILVPVQLLMPTGASIRAGWSAAKGAGQVARSAVPVVKSSAAAASSSWPTLAWYPLEALELMRVSTMRVVRALQALVKFLVTLGSAVNQHRLSLMLQMRQQLRGGLRAAADSPAGRVASAVAVKMGQEQRVQRLHRRLHRNDSSLISAGSELLGHADSAAVGTALSLEGELSIATSFNEGLEDYSLADRGGSVTGATKAGGDSDDEATSALAEISDASPVQLHRSAAGLRHRAGPGSRYANGTYAQRQSDYADAYLPVAMGTSKQVTFADIVPEYAGDSVLAPAPGQRLPVHSLRRSVESAVAGHPAGYWSAGGADARNSSRWQLEIPDSPAAPGVGGLDSAGRYLGSRGLRSMHQQGANAHTRDASGASWWAQAQQNPMTAGNARLPDRGGVQAGLTPVAEALNAAQDTAAAKLRRRNSWG